MAQRSVLPVRMIVPSPKKKIDPYMDQPLPKQVKKVAEVALSSMDKKMVGDDASIVNKKIEKTEIFSRYVPLILSVGALVVLAGFFQHWNKKGSFLDSDNGQNRDPLTLPTMSPTVSPIASSSTEPNAAPQSDVTEDECRSLCQQLRDDFQDADDMNLFDTHADKTRACEALLKEKFCSE